MVVSAVSAKLPQYRGSIICILLVMVDQLRGAKGLRSEYVPCCASRHGCGVVRGLEYWMASIGNVVAVDVGSSSAGVLR